jgi:hypothetical protein
MTQAFNEGLTLYTIVLDWLLATKFRVPITISYGSRDCFFIRSSKHNALIGYMWGNFISIDTGGTTMAHLIPEDPQFFINIEKYINNWKCR